jgi:DNA-binding GntR family transcriptional regulator
MTGDNKMTGESDRPEGLQDFASRRIVRAIVTGELGPGDKLSPTKLAEDLKISHIPVREALAGLANSGYVVRVPRVGFFVTELTLDYIEDVYHWRQVLEDEAHRLAVPKLEDSDIALMRKINQNSARAARYSERYLDLNREFHFIPFERAGSENLLRFLNHLWDSSARYQTAMAVVPLPRTLLKDQHDSLIEAFEARDVKLINARMAEHRNTTLNALREMMSDRQVANDA